MSELVRALTPLILLGLGALVWLEPWLPSGFGQTAALRLVCGLLCLFMALSFIERRQLLSVFEQMLARLKQVQQQGDSDPVEVPDAAQLQRDAIAILVEALGSADDRVRANAAQNLERMTGEKFGEDQSRWRKYLSELGN